jgi:DNA-binding response OmpR family regulator
MNAKKILLAEDDRLLRRACDAALRGRGFQTILAEDGEQAIALARAARPDLILLDVLMPRLSGLDAFEVLRADETTSRIPVLILSNSSREAEMQHASELGAVGYWIKANLSLKELVDGVAALLSGDSHGTGVPPLAG